MAPIVSTAVIVANHNYGRWLCGAIDSVARGTVLPNVCAITDDGSTDGSFELVSVAITDRVEITVGQESFIEGNWRDTHLRVRLHKNDVAQGPSAARNKAIRLCLSNVDSVAILDADDEFYPTKLETLRAAWQSAPDLIGIVYGDYDTVDANGVVVREFKPVYSREHLLRECLIHSGALVSRAALEYVGLYDESLRTCEDYDLWIRATEKFIAYHVPQALTLVRVGTHQSSSTVSQDRWNSDYRKVFEKLRSRQCPQPS